MTTINNFKISNLICTNLCKTKEKISTGIGYADHMIDQLNSHAQIGIAVTVAHNDTDYSSSSDSQNRYASSLDDQMEIMKLLGKDIGMNLRQFLPNEGSSRFCCPLDEALVECNINRSSEDEVGSLVSFTLPPYGIYPFPNGRTKIGYLYTATIEAFFSSLSEAMGIKLQLCKIRGDNAHHIVESAFKAFSRALRNFIDGIDTSSDLSNPKMNEMWGVDSSSHSLGLKLNRKAEHHRSTKETSIGIDLKLDGMASGISINTGLRTLDKIITSIATYAQLNLNINCKGDVHIDDHHTSEDVAIALGQVLNKALGDKAGLNRMWLASSKDSIIEITMDLSNRPSLEHNLKLIQSDQSEDIEKLGDLSIEMIYHFLESLVMNSLMTLHIVQRGEDVAIEDLMDDVCYAFGNVLKMCIAVDPRRAGAVASSKGTLSV